MLHSKYLALRTVPPYEELNHSRYLAAPGGVCPPLDEKDQRALDHLFDPLVPGDVLEIGSHLGGDIHALQTATKRHRKTVFFSEVSPPQVVRFIQHTGEKATVVDLTVLDLKGIPDSVSILFAKNVASCVDFPAALAAISRWINAGKDRMVIFYDTFGLDLHYLPYAYPQFSDRYISARDDSPTINLLDAKTVLRRIALGQDLYGWPPFSLDRPAGVSLTAHVNAYAYGLEIQGEPRFSTPTKTALELVIAALYDSTPDDGKPISDLAKEMDVPLPPGLPQPKASDLFEAIFKKEAGRHGLNTVTGAYPGVSAHITVVAKG